MKYIIMALAAFSPLFTEAQSLHGDLYAGVANYQGDLQGSRFTFSNVGFSGGLGVSYNITSRLIGRTAFTYARISGDDKDNKQAKGIETRNLNFKSNILELQLALEYDILDLDVHSFTPYVFGGGSIYRFNPFTHDKANNKVFLQPLGTEGQGLTEYPDKELYKLTQFAIPFGGGMKLRLSDRIQLGVEIGLRKLFTDYVDDVSTDYADSTILANSRGPLAADLAFRGDELGAAYPAAGAQRGNPKSKDWFYTTGLRIRYSLGTGSTGKNGSTGCPANVF